MRELRIIGATPKPCAAALCSSNLGMGRVERYWKIGYGKDCRREERMKNRRMKGRLACLNPVRKSFGTWKSIQVTQNVGGITIKNET